MNSPVLLRRSRDVIAVRGPDAESYLQGQLSQDVAALADGNSAWSFLLQPTGKVDAWLRITRRGEGDYLLDMDGGFGGAVESRLRRFLLRTDCTVEALDWEAATVLGTVDECIEQLREHLKAGVQQITLVPYRFDMEQIELIAAEILPELG